MALLLMQVKFLTDWKEVQNYPSMYISVTMVPTPHILGANNIEQKRQGDASQYAPRET